MGGVPWAIETNDLNEFKKNPTMVIGYDVSHNKGKNSIFSLNATMDRNYCNYWSRSVQQPPHQEIVNTLQ